MDPIETAETEVLQAEQEVQIESVRAHVLDTIRLRRAEQRLARARQWLAALRGGL